MCKTPLYQNNNPPFLREDIDAELRKQRVQDLRRKARRKKIRRKKQVRNKRVDERKYYGIGVDEKRYEEILRKSFNIEKVLRRTDTQSFTENLEDLPSQAQNLLGVSNNDRVEIAELFVDSWEKGTRRLLNHKGKNIAEQILDDQDGIITDRLEQILQDQNTYYDNLKNEISKKINQEIREGRRQGLSQSDITRNIQREASDLSKNRASTISRTEMTKAHTEATRQVMRQAQIEKVIWLATLDQRTCETCSDLHETVWDTEEAPTPVQSTHPNCRCTLIADQR